MKLIKNDNIDIYNITVIFLQILDKFFWNYNSSKILIFFLSWFTKILNSTTVFNIENKFLDTKSAYYNNF